jgi:phage anti-repressor protein
MAQFNNIKEYNTYLSSKLINLELFDYVINVQELFYKEYNVELLKYLLTLENDNTYTVDFYELINFGIIKKNSEKEIKKIIKEFALIENEDYFININNEYKFTNLALKICLVQTKHTDKYARHYMLLEKIYYNYQNYQSKYVDKCLLNKKIIA